jgi:hypothetical protein
VSNSGPNYVPLPTHTPIPLFNKWFGRINRIEQILSYPCAADPSIWVLGFFTALPTLILTPIKPSPTDYLIVRFGYRHGMRKKFRFDVWDIIRAAEEEEFLAPRWVRFGIGAAARILWYIAVVDAISGFSVRWVSSVYQYAGCRNPGAGFATVHGIPNVYSPSLDGGVFDGMTGNEHSTDWACTNTGIITPAGVSPSVSWSFEWDTKGIPDFLAGNGTVQLYSSAAGGVVDSSPVRQTKAGTNLQQSTYFGVLGGSGGGQFGLQYMPGAMGFINVRSASVEGSAAPKKDQILPDP